jgi:hypothetical protein
VGGRVVAQLADIAGGLEALREAASAPPPPPPAHPAPEPAMLHLPDNLPEVIRAAVAPLIEAIRASDEAMRAQQSQATEAVLRVISEARVQPAADPVPPAEPVAVAPTADEPRLEETLHNLPIVGDTKPLRVWPPAPPKRG